jgi:flavin-dependent dehydrogenase
MLNGYDVVIIGAGPAGCSTALSLAKKGCKIILLNRKSLANFPVGENLDASAKASLSDLNLDVRMMDTIHLPAYHSVSRWANKTPVWKDALYNPNGHGWHLDRLKFDNSLLDALTQRGVEHATCEQMEFQLKGNNWQINYNTGKDSQSLQCKFLVDCSGRSRVVSRKLGIPLLRYDSLMSITSGFCCDNKDTANESIIEAVADGWWYSACVPGNKRVLSFFTNAKTDYFKKHAELDGFYKSFNETVLLKSMLPGLKSDIFSELHFKYANSEKTATVCGNNWIAVGDAAVAFDPLSSQGISTALKMGIAAANAVFSKFSDDSNEGLVRYEKRCNDLFSDYLVQRQKYYASVATWAAADFWKTNSGIHLNTNKQTN